MIFIFAPNAFINSPKLMWDCVVQDYPTAIFCVYNPNMRPVENVLGKGQNAGNKIKVF